MIEFQKWPKTPRLFREIVITEKVDGTNSAVIIQKIDPERDYEYDNDPFMLAQVEGGDGEVYAVAAQSRNRLLTPGKTTDNYGFAAFVERNAEDLVDLLGEGRHFGEWWGDGIQGRYKSASNSKMRGFMLFNVDRHDGVWRWFSNQDGRDVLVEAAPVLYRGEFSEKVIKENLESMKNHGSYVSPFDPAEGICVYHTQSRQVYKYTIDDTHKESK